MSVFELTDHRPSNMEYRLHKTRDSLRRRAAWLAAACGCCCAYVGARGDIITLEPVKDNTLYDDASGSLSNGSGTSLFSGRTNMGARRRALLAFDVASSIPAGSTIESASLTLEMTLTISGPLTIGLHRSLADWGEAGSDALGNEGGGALAEPGDATWLHTIYDTEFWSTVGGDFAPGASATAVVDQEASYDWGPSAGMASDVQGWLDLPGINFGWMLVGNETSFPTAKRFASRENENTAIRPVLTIEFTPPASAGQCCFQIGTPMIGCVDGIDEAACDNQPGQTAFAEGSTCSGDVCADCGDCASNEVCDDVNACTLDTCGADCTCAFVPDFHEATECCNPETGQTVSLDDGNACTQMGVCNPQTGSVTFPPAAADSPCDDGDPATSNDRCDGNGTCVGGGASIPAVSTWGAAVLALLLMIAAKMRRHPLGRRTA